MKFRKKPVVIEATQLQPKHFKPNCDWDFGDDVLLDVKLQVARIFTLEGTMTAHVGDWIVTGVHGEHYPCKPDIFEATYEIVDTDGSDPKEGHP